MIVIWTQEQRKARSEPHCQRSWGVESQIYTTCTYTWNWTSRPSRGQSKSWPEKEKNARTAPSKDSRYYLQPDSLCLSYNRWAPLNQLLHFITILWNIRSPFPTSKFWSELMQITRRRLFMIQLKHLLHSGSRLLFKYVLRFFSIIIKAVARSHSHGGISAMFTAGL